jgi:dCMP deaminase
MDSRYDWDSYFLNIAKAVSLRATCPVASVGAVFVDSDSKSILSIGYNGAPRGTPHCDRCNDRKMGENKHFCKAVHAEMNAIFNAALNAVCLKGSTLYSTVSPCYKCSQGLIQVGTKRVVYIENYSRLLDFVPLFIHSGIGWEQKDIG